MVEVVEEAVGHLCGRHKEVAPQEDTNDASVTPPLGSWTRIRCSGGGGGGGGRRAFVRYLTLLALQGCLFL